MVSILKMQFPLWVVQEAQHCILSDYIVKELSLSAIFMSSPEMLILVSFCSGVNAVRYQTLTNAAHVQRIMKNPLTTSCRNSNL